MSNHVFRNFEVVSRRESIGILVIRVTVKTPFFLHFGSLLESNENQTDFKNKSQPEEIFSYQESRAHLTFCSPLAPAKSRKEADGCGNTRRVRVVRAAFSAADYLARGWRRQSQRPRKTIHNARLCSVRTLKNRLYHKLFTDRKTELNVHRTALVDAFLVNKRQVWDAGMPRTLSSGAH